MISKSTIDTVFETARVEEVIGDFVQLKRAGSNFKGLSPFSDERSPSFMVSPAKQIWKDFSSGKGGNAVAFLMEHEHFTYPEAIRYLAKKYNIEIEETERTDEEKAVTDIKESMYLVSEYAKDYFHDILLHSEEGKAIGYSYFKERGFTSDTIKKFALGYSPEQWDAFSKEALGKGYKLEFLESTGLTINKEERLIDRFRGRVMFPIQSMSGRVLGFGGRILGNDKKAAKYLNSPESDIYHKSKVLYGIFQAKQAIAKNNLCYLVEGYTDVIQFNQSGIENVVASSGTALTPDQIRLVNRLTKNITVLYDGDAAGLRASIRGVDLILEEGMNVRVCTFPEGEDPDSFARKHSSEEILAYLDKNSMDFIQFKASLLMDEAKHDPIKKADLIRDMVLSISKIPDRIKREIYIQETSRIMDISEQVLLSTLAQIEKKEISEVSKKEKAEITSMKVVQNNGLFMVEKIDVLSIFEKNILGILLIYGDKLEVFKNFLLSPNEDNIDNVVFVEKELKVYDQVYLSLQEDETEFTNPIFSELYENVINFYHEKESFNLEQYLMELPQHLAQLVTDIIMDEERYQLHNWEGQNIYVKQKLETISQYVMDNILRLRSYLIRQLVQELMKTLSTDLNFHNDEILSEVRDYNKLHKDISNWLGVVVQIYN